MKFFNQIIVAVKFCPLATEKRSDYVNECI